MVRYLKNWIERIEDQKALNRFVTVEILLARLHFPASVCFALGVLAQTGLVPYIAPHEWRLVFIASFFLTIANGRDLIHCIRHFYQAQPTRNDTLSSLYPMVNNEISAAGGQMQMFGAFALTLGSVSLLNASIITLVRDSSVSHDVCQQQYAASFALFLIGSGANGVLSSGMPPSLESYRILVSFQNLLAAATLCTASVLLLPDIGVEDSMSHFQKSLLNILSSFGCMMLVMSSLVHYFHTQGYCTLHHEGYNLLVEERKSQFGRKSKRMAAWETVKGLFWSRKSAWWKQRKLNRGRARYVGSTGIDRSVDEENQAVDDDDSEASNSSASSTSESSSNESFSTAYDEETGSRSSFVSEESENEQVAAKRERT
ncbi:hypothetical protein FGB62_25g163 [Gracilaria domingensis]|nr:hypothetical protein FGB62_25g163 [Gracilaria domingensis]